MLGGEGVGVGVKSNCTREGACAAKTLPKSAPGHLARIRLTVVSFAISS